MMKNPSNRDLHVMLARIEERQVFVIEKVDGIKNWQETHQTNDTKQFKELNDNINSMNKYAASIATVAGFIGAGAVYAWNYLTGRA